jgi:hypothetical protein
VRAPEVVAELDAEAPDMPVHDPALRHEVRTPDQVQDLVPRDDAPGAAGKHVEDALLDAAQVGQGAPGTNLPVHDVDLDLADLDRRDDRKLGPRRPPADDDRTRKQLFGGEGHRDDVIDPEAEGPKACLQVASSGETQHGRDTATHRAGGTQPPQQVLPIVVVHVDHGEVRPPFRQDRLGPGERSGGPDHEQAVVQRQLDQVDEQRVFVEHERSSRVQSRLVGHASREGHPRGAVCHLPRGLPAIYLARHVSFGLDLAG